MKGIAKNSQEYVDAMGLKRWLGLDLEFDQDVKSPEEALVEVELKVRNAIAKSNGQEMLNSSIPPGPPPVIQIKPEDREIGVTPEAILSSPDLKVLETYRWLITANPELKRAYTLRHDQLKKLEKQ